MSSDSCGQNTHADEDDDDDDVKRQHYDSAVSRLRTGARVCFTESDGLLSLFILLQHVCCHHQCSFTDCGVREETETDPQQNQISELI